MLPNPIIPSKTSKAVAVVTFLLSATWILFCVMSAYTMATSMKDGGLTMFLSITTLAFSLLGGLGVYYAIHLFKRPMFDNFRYSIGIFSYALALGIIAVPTDHYEVATSLFLSVVVGSVLYYALTCWLGKLAGFSKHPLHRYFSNGLPGLLTFLLWIDSAALASHFDWITQHGAILFLPQIALLFCFYKLTSRYLKDPLTTKEAELA